MCGTGSLIIRSKGQVTADYLQKIISFPSFKKSIEDMLKSDKSTIVGILDDKMEQIGARSTLLKLEPILSKHIKDLEMIAPTISGEFIKQLKEM